MENKGLERINRMLEIAHTDDAVFPPTDLYNEGWIRLPEVAPDGVFPLNHEPFPDTSLSRILRDSGQQE